MKMAKKCTHNSHSSKSPKNPYYSRCSREEKTSNGYDKCSNKISRGNSVVNFIRKFICS